MSARLVLREHALLVLFRQPDVAVAVAMDVHEHGPSEEKRVFVYPRLWPFGDTWQGENSFAQFLIQF